MNVEKLFSIGEITKLTGLTVRTLQYYDNIGLVPLDKEKTNGRRFYREKDLVRLQQVLFYKSLGLEIKEIKNLLNEEVTPKQLITILEKQKETFYQKLNEIKGYVVFIEASIRSIKESGSYPLGHLIQLIGSLNKDTFFEYKNIEYDPKIATTFENHYNNEDFLEVYWEWKSLILEAVSHKLNSVHPKSEQGLMFSKKWLNMVERITKGNEDLLAAHKSSYENRSEWPEEDRRLMEFADDFIDQATEYYLIKEKDRSE